MEPFRAAYIAFDPHPSSKGASTHIHHFAEVLAEEHGPLLLLTLQGNHSPIRTEKIHQVCFLSAIENWLDRAMAFTRWVKDRLSRAHSLVIVHFRDVWGGMAALSFPHFQTVFEVNGLPSIELPYRYPLLAADTLAKIKELEGHCMRLSDVIVTPSRTTAAYLAKRGISSSKISVVPNGAAPFESFGPRVDLPPGYFTYVGALQPWQGVHDLLRALQYLEDTEAKLVICCSHDEHLAKPHRVFAEELGVAHRLIWLYQCSRSEVNQVLQYAKFSVAPLTECSRNIEQGCSPLKIIESMANGTAVISTLLPPVQEIVTHRADGILCRPSRPADLARNIRLALENGHDLKALGVAAREKIKGNFTWENSGNRLRSVYQSLTIFA